ncbi:MAG TPA: ABC transporter family substrate-binding protein, partial [Acidimicrobiia bacterium]|nr:ABC transporter family substrate-binding protein [Acidimicrobiia bacterium]
MRRRSRLVALAAAVGLIFTACGSGGGSTKENGASAGSGKGGPSSTAYDINAVAREKVPQGGTLRWPLDQIPPNLNYNEVDGTLRDTTDIMNALMPSIFIFDAASVPTVNKTYAESAELTAKDPKQV